MEKTKKTKQLGAVSLFVVVFSALLITIVTVGFIGLMVRNQKQASDSDLSQSAYDSAMAGVEDGKRAILRYLECLDSSDSSCPEIKDIMENASSQTCTNLVDDLDGIIKSQSPDDNEILVKSGNSADLNQAYTCLKVEMDTPDFLGVIEKDGNKVVPLEGVDSYNKVKIDWFTVDDLTSGTTADIPSTLDKKKLMINQNDWVNRPAIMRTQLIQYASNGFKLADFDNNNGNESNTNTLFLHPYNLSVPIELSFVNDNRRSENNSDNILESRISCKKDFTATGALGYACTTIIELPDPIGGSADNRVAYLNLTSLYNKSNFKVSLLDAGNQVVKFSAVQPEVDSNGRANDLFRRVKVRVEIANLTGLVPSAAVETTDDTGSAEDGLFCKDYTFYEDQEPYNGCGF